MVDTLVTYSPDDAVLTSEVTNGLSNSDGTTGTGSNGAGVTDTSTPPWAEMTSSTVHGDGADRFTTTWRLDQRGMATSATIRSAKATPRSSTTRVALVLSS